MSKKIFKISLLGEKDVGKTSMLATYMNKEFNLQSLSTIGIVENFIKKTFDKVEYKFKIFDTAGQERYNSIATSTIQIADGFFMVFAVNHKGSYEKVVTWINSIKEYVNLKEKVLFIIGNKCDVNSEERVVGKDEAENFAKGYNAKYLETSAFTRKGIDDAFENMFKDVYEMYKKNKNDNNRNSNIVLDNNNAGNAKNKDPKKKKCFFF